MAFIDKAMVVSKLVVYPMFASLSSELTNVDCTALAATRNPPSVVAHGGAAPRQTQPSQPQRQAEAADPGVALKPIGAVLSNTTPAAQPPIPTTFGTGSPRAPRYP